MQKYLASCIYKLMYYLYKKDIYKSKWILKMENIIQEVGFNYVWLNNDVRNIDTFCKIVTTRLQCQFVQNWNEDVVNSSKYLNYRLFKTTFTLFARSFRRRFFAYHYAVKHPHICLILS